MGDQQAAKKQRTEDASDALWARLNGTHTRGSTSPGGVAPSTSDAAPHVKQVERWAPWLQRPRPR